jgi:hypothetical protein
MNTGKADDKINLNHLSLTQRFSAFVTDNTNSNQP